MICNWALIKLNKLQFPGSIISPSSIVYIFFSSLFRLLERSFLCRWTKPLGFLEVSLIFSRKLQPSNLLRFKSYTNFICLLCTYTLFWRQLAEGNGGKCERSLKKTVLPLFRAHVPCTCVFFNDFNGWKFTKWPHWNMAWSLSGQLIKKNSGQIETRGKVQWPFWFFTQQNETIDLRLRGP